VSRYFSNGTEGYAWMAQWCDRCALDHGMYRGNGDGGCQIVALALVDGDAVIPEWIDETEEKGFTFPPAVTCIMFERCRPCFPDKNDPPKPRPPIPGQSQFFDMPEHHLMYRDVVLSELGEEALR
jgi:hypothetical protein